MYDCDNAAVFSFRTSNDWFVGKVDYCFNPCYVQSASSAFAANSIEYEHRIVRWLRAWLRPSADGMCVAVIGFGRRFASGLFDDVRRKNSWCSPCPAEHARRLNVK